MQARVRRRPLRRSPDCTGERRFTSLGVENAPVVDFSAPVGSTGGNGSNGGNAHPCSLRSLRCKISPHDPRLIFFVRFRIRRHPPGVPTMNHDTELLRRFVDERSEAAFTDLVQRHVGLVYHTALRRVGGDVQHAEDVTQTVFVALARQAPQLLRHPTLGGWLFVTAQNASAEFVRREQRRKAREATAQAMHLSDQPAAPVPAADPLRPVLDDALMSLPADDRDAIVLRFFEQRSFADVGQALKLSEDAARKRVDRSLDKLQEVLRRRGIVTASAALGGALTAAGAGPAPTGLALQVAARAFAQAGVATAAGTSLLATLVPAAVLVAG